MRIIQANIWKVIAIKSIGSFMVMIPILVLFMQENGLSMAQVFLLQSLFSVVVFVFEVPSGYMSDKWGRRFSIVLGVILGTIGYLAYSVSYSFAGFLIAEILLALSVSAISGADSALLYDSLLSYGREGEYKQTEGRSSSLAIASEGVASIIGGMLAIISLRTPVYVEMMVSLLVKMKILDTSPIS